MRILLIAYYYPPLGGAGVQRPLKFSKYLARAGVELTVICADNPHYTQDASMLAEIPAGAEVIRIAHAPLPARVLAWLRRRRSGTAATKPARPAAVQSAPLSATGGWRERLLRLWSALQYPDEQRAWAAAAYPQARRLVESGRIDLILSTSAPVSAHWLAWRLARASGTAWVADFRDLWLGNPAYQAPRWRRTLDRRLEAALLDAADGVTTVTETLAARLTAQRSRTALPVRAISNGFDEADFADLQPLPRNPHIRRIVHVGTFYGHQSPEPLLDAAALALEQGRLEAQQLQVRLIGNIGSRFDGALQRFEACHPGVLERVGYMAHREALREMVSADALLLVVGGSGESVQGVMTGKIFEYLRAGRPILMIGPADCAAAELIGQCGAGAVVPQHDTAAIADRLVALLGGETATYRPDRSIERFSRESLTGALLDYLGEVQARRAARR
ncbi:glycosyltransferase [Chitinimonas koreensis]|uniref:glycosyltransferase n=1 Tax=Chitinimonas koreensis TaxID=356302 RepID=UPI00040038A4|nr:glycosyltransferase [Chitinimonas koreensis]QNM97369.1 glycosyltransferase [Chitinimonas koreensis]